MKGETIVSAPIAACQIALPESDADQLQEQCPAAATISAAC